MHSQFGANIKEESKPIAVILAAGGSRRLGYAKSLIEFRGESLLQRTINLANQVGFDSIVVYGAQKYEVTGAELLENLEWESGVASSIRLGVLRALEHHATHALLLAVDQPLVVVSDIEALVSACPDDGISAASYDEVTGIPAFFSRRYFENLTNLQGDVGAQSFLGSTPEVVTVPIPNASFDVDDDADVIVLRALK